MSQVNSFSSQTQTQQQKQQGQPVTSLRKDYLKNLRFPSNNKNKGQIYVEKPRIHLLACMSQFIPDQPENKLQQIQDFCCFDRIKKVVQKVDNDLGWKKGKNDGQSEIKQKNNLMKLVQVENKIKKMQQTLMKYSSQQNKNKNQFHILENKDSKSSFYDTTNSNLFLTATAQDKWKDGIITDSQSKIQNKNHNLFGQYEMRKNIRQQGFKQYLQWQKKKIIKSENDVRQFVESQIDQKVKNMLEERDIKFNELLKKNKNLQRLILQKNLQIQNLKSKQSTLTRNMRELQVFKNQFSEQNTFKIKDKQIFLENFYQQFCDIFPGETVQSMKIMMETITDKCLNKFNEIESKKVDKWKQQKLQMLQKIKKLESIINKFKENQNQLLTNLKQFRHQQNSAHMQIDLLVQKQVDLQRLQKKILSLYNDWYGRVPQSSKEIMKNIGYLQTNYGYEQMLQHIVVFENKLSADSKVNDYLIKILRGIQRIRKILFPRTVSNSDDRKEILDPLYILQKLQKYIKSKVFQVQKKANFVQKGSRTSHIIEEQFLGVEEDKISEQLKIESDKNQPFKKHLSLSTGIRNYKRI